MIFIKFNEYDLKFLESDLINNTILQVKNKELGLKKLKSKIKEKKKLDYLKFDLVWVVNEKYNLLNLHYNLLLLYFFFGNNIYFNKVRQGRVNKKIFYIFDLKVNIYFYYEFFSFFFFDFLRYLFFLENNVFGTKRYEFSMVGNNVFLRLYNFDLFFNKRLSEKLPLFFSNIKIPFNIELSLNFNKLFNNKIWKNIKN